MTGGLASSAVAHQADDFAQRGVRACAMDLDQQAAIRVDRAGHDLAADGHVHGHALAGEARHVEAGAALADNAVGRDAVAGAQFDQVAAAQRAGGHGFELGVGALAAGAGLRQAGRGHGSPRASRAGCVPPAHGRRS